MGNLNILAWRKTWWFNTMKIMYQLNQIPSEAKITKKGEGVNLIYPPGVLPLGAYGDDVYDILVNLPPIRTKVQVVAKLLTNYGIDL